tara:strand:- start:1 stop:381 length:381 start_codon:yes stop_codon:yes gene_type:complete
MSFGKENTTFGFTMRVPEADAAHVDGLIESHANWMKETHSLNEEEGKLHTLEYYVTKSSEYNDMMDPSKGTTGNIIYSVNEVHKDGEHLKKHTELGQKWERINEFFELFSKYSPLVTMGGSVIAKL